MPKVMLSVAALVCAALVGGALWLTQRPSDPVFSEAMMNADGASIGGPFALTTHTGEAITSDALIDGPTLIYFGYTYCPDICPIDMQIMADAVTLLDEQGVAVKPVFITVDPERDTPKELTYFVEGMHPRMIGLTGTAEQVRAAADAYKVYYARVEQPDSSVGYLMQHTGFTYLVTPEKGVTAIFKRDFPADQIASDVARVLDAL